MRALVIRKNGELIRDYQVTDDMTIIHIQELPASVPLLSPKNRNESLETQAVDFKLTEKLNTYDGIAIFREV